MRDDGRLLAVGAVALLALAGAAKRGSRSVSPQSLTALGQRLEGLGFPDLRESIQDYQSNPSSWRSAGELLLALKKDVWWNFHHVGEQEDRHVFEQAEAEIDKALGTHVQKPKSQSQGAPIEVGRYTIHDSQLGKSVLLTVSVHPRKNGSWEVVEVGNVGQYRHRVVVSSEFTREAAMDMARSHLELHGDEPAAQRPAQRKQQQKAGLSSTTLAQIRAAVNAAYRSQWGHAMKQEDLREAVVLPKDTRRAGDFSDGTYAVIFTEYAGLSQYDNHGFWRSLQRELDKHKLYYEWYDGGTATIHHG